MMRGVARIDFRFSVAYGVARPSWSMTSDVHITKDARFKFQIIQPVLNEIAYADNASELAIAKHRHMSHATSGHQAHQVGEIIPEGCR